MSARQDDAVGLEIDSERVGKYERAGFSIHPGPLKGNPYDADEMDVSMELVSPGGKKLILPAFHYQSYERRDMPGQGAMRNWLYPVGAPTWRARFAPMEVGKYSAQTVVRNRGRTRRSEKLTFECVASESGGFLRVSKRDPRFFELSEGSSQKPFFAIGMNMCFVKNLQEHEGWMGNLGRSGGNFVRIWACCKDWGMSIEGRKSAWGRSWSWDPQIAFQHFRDGFDGDRMCVRVAGEKGASVTARPSHAVAIRPNTKYVLTGSTRTTEGTGLIVLAGQALGEPVPPGGRWHTFRREFTTRPDQWWLDSVSLRLAEKGTAWVRDLSLTEAVEKKRGKPAPQLPNLLWEADVNRPAMGVYNQLDSFMMDEIVRCAEANGIRLQVVILPRDLYMHTYRDLLRDADTPEYDRAIRSANNLLRYAVARWGYSTSVGLWEYFNEMDPGAPTDRFYDELGRYFEETDIYGHPRSTSNWHSSPRDWSHPRLDIIDLHRYMGPAGRRRRGNWSDEVQFVLESARPALEHKMTKPVLMSEFGLAGPVLYRTMDKNLVHFHNTLWASSMSGLAGTTMCWWWDTLAPMDAWPHYRPLAAFLSDIPFTTAKFRRIADVSSDAPVRYVGLLGGDCAYLWVYNPQATWQAIEVEKQVPKEVRGASLEIGPVAQGEYRVQWWHTREGKVIEEANASSAGGKLRISVPAFTTDVACRIVRLEAR